MKKQRIQNKAENLSDILNDAMQNLRHAVDVNTVVGKPVLCEDGTVVIPVSKVYVGLISGGGEINNAAAKSTVCEYPFAGGTGAGFTISPIGFLVNKKGETTFINTETDKSSEKLIEMANRTLKILLENIKKENKWG